jgi:hypothetical protein
MTSPFGSESNLNNRKEREHRYERAIREHREKQHLEQRDSHVRNELRRSAGFDKTCTSITPMRTNPSLKSFKLSTLISLATAIVFLAMPETARCGTIFGTRPGSNTIGKYNATTGAPINPSLVSGLFGLALGIVVSGGDLFVTDANLGTIGKYNAATGAPVNPSLVSGLVNASDIALSGGNLFVTHFEFVTDSFVGTIGVYDATTGAAINPSLVSGLNHEDDGARTTEPFGIAVTTPSSVPDFGPGMFLVAVVFASLLCVHRWTGRPV